jgi:hypothetical protein
VATATTTPAITLTLGAITPSSVAATGTVTGSNSTLQARNTADVSSNASTATPLSDLTLTVAASTKYTYRLVCYLSSNTSTQNAINLNGSGATATLTSIQGRAIWYAAAGINVVTITALSTSNKSVVISNVLMIEEGTMEVNGGGTIIPVLTATAGLTVQKDSYITATPIS